MAGYDQEAGGDPFLTDNGAEQRRELEEEKRHLLEEKKVRLEALLAHSKLRSWSLAILLSIAVFFGMMSLRLELSKQLRWPLYIDFIPLGILPCFVYLAATDFAATRVSVDAALAKVVIVIVGFIVAVDLLFLAVFICLRLIDLIEWRWTYVVFPFWGLLALIQMFFCYLIPGFIQMDKLQLCFEVFAMIWLVALGVLLITLKLDGELSEVHWCLIFIPVQTVLSYQVNLAVNGSGSGGKPSASFERSYLDITCIMALLTCSILIPLQLEGDIELPWAVILLGPEVAVVLACVQIWQGKNM
mmetsp:Transcript_60016/g.110244  ORF Transcript_60016/g.110244 Transcript_60016/m.110244 type:complete len:301 (+) Transcript_60016:94-996(+)